MEENKQATAPQPGFNVQQPMYPNIPPPTAGYPNAPPPKYEDVHQPPVTVVSHTGN